MENPVENLDSKPKRKNEDKRKGRSRHITIGAGLVIFSVILLAIGVIALQPRFTPMSDMPVPDLVFREWSEIYILDFQAGKRSILTSITGVDTPYMRKLSPDGRRFIEFNWLEDEGKSLLLLKDLTNQEPDRALGKFGLFYNRYNNTQHWSPDQQWVTFFASPFDSEVDTYKEQHATEIWMLHIPTGEIRRLTNNAYHDEEPYFSPDGTQLAYISEMDGFPRLYVMNMATGESRLLTPDYHAHNPVWSPDGEWIAYQDTTSEESRSLSLYAIRADGTHLQTVNVSDESSSIMGWKPQ